MPENTTMAASELRSVRALYILILFIMALTGFGQMPIYNRYYLSDIPGFGWLADFYITRNIHYIGAVLLIGLSVFMSFDFLLSKRRHARLSASGWLRALILSAVGASGALIVIKNFPYVHFSDRFIIGLDLFHLTAAVTFLMANLVCLITKKKWAATA